MTLLQWLILLAVVVVVGAGYWFLRGRASTDPWRNLDHGGPRAPDAGAEAGDDYTTDHGFEGRDLGGDSYIVAVRTLTAEPPAHGGLGGDTRPGQPVSDEDAEVYWQAYKKSYAPPRRDDPQIDPSHRATAQAPTAPNRDKRSDLTNAPEVPPEPGPVFDPETDHGSARKTSDEADCGAEAEQQSARWRHHASEIGASEPEKGEQRHHHGSRHVPESDVSEKTPENWQQTARFAPAEPAGSSAQEPDQLETASAESSVPETPREHIEPQPRLTDEQEIFVIHVFAGRNQRYAGVDIHPALADQGLRFGFKNLYHRVVERDGRLISAYGVASMINPGTLDPADQHDLFTPGLTLFMVAPGTETAPGTLRDMMETANALTIALGGQVLDDRHAVLKAQTAQYMLDRAAELDRRATLAKRR